MRPTAGADALLIVTPYYIRPPQRGLVAYYLELAKGHDLPWMIYHIPGRTAISVTLDTIKELQGQIEEFRRHEARGRTISASSRSACTRLAHDFQIFVGLEELSFPMMAVGACGLMNAVGNLRPSVLARDVRGRVGAAISRRAQKLHDQLHELNKAVFFDTNPTPMKYMAKRLGMIAEQRAPPADGAGDARAGEEARRRARARGLLSRTRKRAA